MEHAYHLLQKLNYKNQDSILLLNLPDDFTFLGEVLSLQAKVHETRCENGTVGFALIFRCLVKTN